MKFNVQVLGGGNNGSDGEAQLIHHYPTFVILSSSVRSTGLRRIQANHNININLLMRFKVDYMISLDPSHSSRCAQDDECVGMW
jgi:hypothetical protein